MRFGVITFSYSGSHFAPFPTSLERSGYYSVNLGDNAQTIASRLALTQQGISPDSILVLDRDSLARYNREPVAVVMNGVFLPHCFPLPPAIRPLFVGFNAGEEVISRNRDYFKHLEPIGCREPATAERLRRVGVAAHVTGCLTLSFPQRTTPSGEGKVFVVYGSGAGQFPSECLAHAPRQLFHRMEFVHHRLPIFHYPLTEQDCLKVERFENAIMDQLAAEARLVITPLHHVAAPCLARGIPTIVVRHFADDRFGFLEQFVPIYTPNRFHQINWNPNVPDLRVVAVHQKAELAACISRVTRMTRAA
ncbi:MAG: polysaccharide pyruvyl transferase family protein [Gemmataceae bacterium]